ncbi:hypothetical protein AX16_005653 [Volvariella volvacea WC 439]|nr:hypothetical protein AX16_005653 [Volvariella volvacea WC 439]
MPPVVPQIDDMPADESQVTPQDLDLTEPGFIQLFESRSTLTQPPAVNHPLQQNHWPDQQATCQTSSSGDQGHHDISLETSYDVSITIQNTNGTDATDHVAVPTDTTSFTPETNAPALSPQSSPHPSLLTSPLPHSSAVSLNSSDSAFLGTSQSEYSASPQFSTRAASVPASLEFVGSDGIPSVFGTPFHPVSSLSASSSPGNLPPLDLPVTHSSTDAHNEPSTSTDGLLLAPVQTQDAVAPSLPHSHLVKRTSPKRLHKVINAPRLSSSLTLSSDASVRPYACGREECWSSDAVMGKTCYATAKELFDHMREEHSDDSNGTGDAPFRCALAGCGKSWKSLNGLQYHLQISLAHFRDAVSSTFSRSQASLESEDPGGQASDAPDRTHRVEIPFEAWPSSAIARPVASRPTNLGPEFRKENQKNAEETIIVL